MALAIPASCESERCTSWAPMPCAEASTVPVSTNRGRPPSSLTTSASCQASPAGAPRAFAIASLAAKRAAREAGGSAASAAVNSRSRSPGVRTMDSLKRAMSTTSMPTPTITGGSLHGDGLGEVARLVDVVALQRGQLAGEELQRDRRDDRLEQGRHHGQRDHHVRPGRDIGVALLGQHDGAGAAGADLLDRADHLVVELVATPWRHD